VDRATGWAPPSTRGSETVALSTDTVYAGGPSSGGGTGCGEAFSLGTAAKTAWNPRITSGGAECGGVSSLAVSGDRVWNAGASAALANALPRKGYAAIDVAKDEILPWSPQHEGEQGIQPADLALSPDGATVYIADTGMQRLNGVDRLKVAAVSATGAARSSDDVRAWDPSPHYPDPEAPRGERYSYGVRRVQPSADGRTVLLAGSFLTLDGQDRPNLAATSASTGVPTAWRPAPNGDVDALELAGDGTIYVGGPFTTLGSSGAARRYLGAFAGPTEGQPTTWDPRLAAEAVGEPPVIQDLALGDGVVYAAGNFRGQIGGQDRHGVAALNRTDGRATAWDAAVNGEVSTVSTTADGTVYLVADNNYSGGFYEGPFTKVQDQDRFGTWRRSRPPASSPGGTRATPR
jgi:DNA-binding beta-propeller fold protein YncE